MSIMNPSPEAQFQLALKMPMPQLIAIMQGQPSPISQAVAMSALQQRREMQTAMQGQQAAQQMRVPSVKDREIMKARADQMSQLPENVGIGPLPAPNMDNFKEGGIIGYAERGLVDGDVTYKKAMEESFPVVGSQYLGAGIADIIRAPGQLAWDWDHYKRTGEMKRKYETQGVFPVTSSLAESRPVTSTPTPQPSGTGIAPGYGYYRTPTEPTPTEPTASAPAARAAPPAARAAPQTGLGALANWRDIDRGENLQAAQPAATAAAPTAPAVSPLSEYMQNLNAQTSGLFAEAGDIVKKLTTSDEEKTKRGEQRKGEMALAAMEKLLSRPGIGALGDAAGTVGRMVERYAEADREDERRAWGAQLNYLLAKANFQQGNTKIAADLYNNAEQNAYRYAALQAEREWKERELGLKRQGIDKETFLKERELGIMEAYRRSQAPYFAAHAAALNAQAEAGNAGLKAQKSLIDTRNSLVRQLAGEYRPDEKKRLTDQIKAIDDRLGSLSGVTYAGSPSLIPDNVVSDSSGILDLTK
jgi:hypothetical protein